MKSYATKPASVASSTLPLARLSDVVTIKTKHRGNSTVHLGDGHDILTAYAGPGELRAALEQNQAEPLSLASADFDEDGVPDLVTSYSFDDRGIVTLMRGNVDAIYPNSPEAQQRRRNGTFTQAPFVSPAYVFSTPVAAEFIAAGDFNGDDHWDVIAASRNKAALYLLAGNGKGEFPTVKKMALPGLVTALVAGEINRRDGLTDLIVGIDGPAQVLVFEGPGGAFNSTPEVLPMPTHVASLALGQLDDKYEIDLLVASGSELIFVHGRDRQLLAEPSDRVRVEAPHLEHRSLPSVIRDLTLGDFKAQQKLNAAVVMENGNVQLLDAGAAAGAPLAKWKIETLERSWGNASKIITAKVSSLPGDDLLVSDADGSGIQIVRSSSRKPTTQISASDRGLLSTIEGVDTAPVAILPMRLNSDAFSDLTIVKSGRVSPTILTTKASATFVVTNTNDSGPGSLRQAVTDAQNNPGADLITFNIDPPTGGAKTIALQSFLPVITEPVTIDATTQPGFAGQPLIELNGVNSTPHFAAFDIYAGNTTVRGFVINRFHSNGLTLLLGGGNIIEGNYIGTNVAGTAASPNDFRGIGIGGDQTDPPSSNNRIGGTTLPARNIISGNKVHGVRILNLPSTGNIVQGNYIGTDVTGTVGLGNHFEGIYIGGGLNNTVGGTEPGAGNLISSNGTEGVSRTASGVHIGTFPFETGATGNLVQGNRVGTNASGTAALGNAHEGAMCEDGASSNTIGGTTAAARNIISGNGTNGVDLGFDKKVELNQVLGNFIGTDVTGNNPLPNNLHGIFINVNSVNNTIRDNRIAFNLGSGIFIPNTTPEPNDEPGFRIAIDSNEIFSNGELGIDLGIPGITENDPLDTDGGANLLQNFPVLTSATASAASGETVWKRAGEVGREMPDTTLAAALTINGTLNSTPNATFTVHWYFSNDAQCITNQAASRPLVFGKVPNVITNSNGDAQFSIDFDFPSGITGGIINCTATDAQGNTSEFSACLPVRLVRTLTVTSSNPGSGVAVTISPNDNNGAGNGTTQFTRVYNDAQSVSLTAPAIASGNNFQKWLKDGADFANNTLTNVSVTMDANHTMTAVYVTPARTLTVASSNPASGVSITVSPNDNGSQGNGTTQFTRTYNNNTVVSLTAPATTSGNNFQKWLKDGADFANNTVTNVSVTMDANHTMTAVYLTPTPTGPTIFVEAGTNNLAALDSVSLVRGPFALTNTGNFSSDQRTRIIFFTTDLGFAQATQPDVNTLSVQVNGKSYPVESVGPDSTISGSYIVFRLPDLAAPGTYPLGIRLGGVNSTNAPNLGIVSSPSSPAATPNSKKAKLFEYLLFSLTHLIL